MNPRPSDPLKARRTSAWSLRSKVRRQLWYWTQGTLFRFSPRGAFRWRNWLLRRFGATAPRSARIRANVKIEIPWHLSLGEHAIVGDEAILYCLGPVRIGHRVMVSQYAHICSGTHDHTVPELPLTTAPIVVGDDAWIAADTFVGPGVTIGEGTVVGARASVFSDLPPWTVCVGNPAKPIKDRERFPQR